VNHGEKNGARWTFEDTCSTVETGTQPVSERFHGAQAGLA